MATAAQIAELENLTPKLPKARQEFAQSLCAQFKSGKPLSGKQDYWVGKLIEIALSGEESDVSPKRAVGVGDVQIIHDMFAKTGLQKPSVNLALLTGDVVQLSPASKTGKNKGCIYVTDGGPYGSNTYYGKITPDGTFFVSQTVGPDMRGALSALIAHFATHPAEAAADYGHMSGCCSFCSKKLDDETSIALGYGPVCAKKWKLPHNGTAAKAAEAKKVASAPLSEF